MAHVGTHFFRQQQTVIPYEDATGRGGWLESQLQKIGVRRTDAFE